MPRLRSICAAFGLAGMLASGCGGRAGNEQQPQAPSRAPLPPADRLQEPPRAERAAPRRPRAGSARAAPASRLEDRRPIEILDRVYFGENDEALPRELEPLEAYAAAAGADAGVTLVLIAHADAAEREPERLSRQRAEAVKSYLVGRGVAAERVRVRAMGAREPIRPGDGAGDAENRCVELAVETGK